MARADRALRRVRGPVSSGSARPLRLNEEIREKQGIAYSPSASATSSDAFPGYGYIAVGAETPPQVPQPLRPRGCRRRGTRRRCGWPAKSRG